MTTTKKTAKKTTKAEDIIDEVDVIADETVDTDEPQSDFFDEFRDRAIAMGHKSTKTTNKPFVLGAEYGFEPAVSLPKPGYKTRTLIQNAMTQGNLIAALQLVFDRDIDRVLDALDVYEEETGVNGEIVMSGILVSYMEHFYGKGAVDQAFRMLSI